MPENTCPWAEGAGFCAQPLRPTDDDECLTQSLPVNFANVSWNSGRGTVLAALSDLPSIWSYRSTVVARRGLGVPYDQPATTVDYEKALLECAAGRGRASAIIYRIEAPRLRAVAYRILRNHECAEDALHDAFVQILRDARNFDPQRGSARAWIYTIVRNTALKALKRGGREIPVEAEELFDLMGSEPQRLLDTPDRSADEFDLLNCLEALEPRRRASLILAFVDGRTHAEIATCLGVPVGTVKSWIRRELVALREQLK